MRGSLRDTAVTLENTATMIAQWIKIETKWIYPAHFTAMTTWLVPFGKLARHRGYEEATMLMMLMWRTLSGIADLGGGNKF